MSKKALYFTLGTLFGTASGILAGMLLAPRSGAESRAMAADAMNDVWDSAVDTYERGAQTAADKFNGVRPVVDAPVSASVMGCILTRPMRPAPL